jgi:hypothetical protein
LRILARRIDDQISTKRYWRDLSFLAHHALSALAVSAGRLRSFVLLLSLRSGAAFLRSSTNSGHQ